MILRAQSGCNAYYPFEKGTKFEITNFNKKGKKEGVVRYQVSNVENNVATLATQILDAKGKELTSTSYNVTCQGDLISIDFKSLMNPELLTKYGDLEVDMTGNNIEFPNNLEVGQALKDANMNMVINMGGMNMNMTINMIDRKVISKESVTTPAGTFDCFVLSYASEIKMGVTYSFTSKEWIAKGVGLVKNETYNNKGSLMSYSELTNLER
ncbi:TapB family protein [Cognatitamlana onchidii]|uniref:TapB family protein n=1 Tax=Cognatitamlana onchidii TaxID=2562860 RepID=UPI001F1AF2FD|nr:hypothetical protein [Algibacter onchidii]